LAQGPGTALDVTAGGFATDGGAVDLSASGNLFAGSVGVDAEGAGGARGDVSLTAAGALALRDVAARGLTLEAGGPITQASGVVDAAQAASATTAGAEIALTAAGNVFDGPLALSTDRDGVDARAAAAATTAGALTLGDVFAGDLTLEAASLSQNGGAAADVTGVDVATGGG
ncbi:MAG: hypothetical protein AAFU61_18330, partial [Pseudomonadota bacterium]